MRIVKFVVQPLVDLVAALEAQVLGRGRPAVALVLALVALVVGWFVYVPIHELLHAAGCLATGGEVVELQVQARYGGALLAKVFSFVHVGGDYAGRLTDFEDHGSDWIYLATVFGPFLLTVFPGVALLLVCTRRRAPLLFGASLILAMAPLTNLTGDYFEMGSIVVTRAARLADYIDDEALGRLRSDDVFRLFDELSDDPLPQSKPLVFGLIAGSALAAVVLALLTYLGGRLIAGMMGLPANPEPRQAGAATASDGRPPG